MRTTAVIGGNGFIGRHLVDALIGSGAHRVIVITRKPPAARPPGAAGHAQADMCDEAALRRAMDGADTVFHLGATIPNAFVSAPEAVWRGNTEGAAAVTAACRSAGVKNLVYVTGLLGAPSTPPARARDALPFVHAKCAAEEIVLAAHGEDGLAACSVRAPVIFGAGDKITWDFLRGRAPVFPGFATTFSFMYVDDLTRLLLLVEEALAARSDRVAGKALEAHGERMTFADFFSLPAWDRPPPRFVPYRAVRVLAAANAWCARLAGVAPLGAEMCPEVLDTMALSCRKDGGASMAEALGLPDLPPSVAAGIRALRARR